MNTLQIIHHQIQETPYNYLTPPVVERFCAKKLVDQRGQVQSSVSLVNQAVRSYIIHVAVTFRYSCFRLKKGSATFFRPERTIASFFLRMMLLFKMLSNHSIACIFKSNDMKYLINVIDLYQRKFCDGHNILVFCCCCWKYLSFMVVPF